MLLLSLSNVGVVDLEVCCPIFGIFHFAPRYFNIINRSKLSLGRVPNCCFLKRHFFFPFFSGFLFPAFFLFFNCCFLKRHWCLLWFSLLPSDLIYRGLFLFTFEDNFYFNFSVSFTVFFYCNNLFSYGFFFPFFLLLKDSFKIIFSQHAIGAYFGFRNYPRILCTSGSFSFHLWGHFFSFSFFFAFLSVYSGGGGGETLQFLRKL